MTIAMRSVYGAGAGYAPPILWYHAGPLLSLASGFFRQTPGAFDFLGRYGRQ